LQLFGRVHFVKQVPVIQQRITVVYFELGIFQPMQQHVHACQVEGSDVLFLAVDLANTMRPYLIAYIQQQ